ncbi:unnamed protein product [Gordionus sp. m RMFG-2023]
MLINKLNSNELASHDSWISRSRAIKKGRSAGLIGGGLLIPPYSAHSLCDNVYPIILFSVALAILLYLAVIFVKLCYYIRVASRKGVAVPNLLNPSRKGAKHAHHHRSKGSKPDHEMIEYQVTDNVVVLGGDRQIIKTLSNQEEISMKGGKQGLSAGSSSNMINRKAVAEGNRVAEIDTSPYRAEGMDVISLP